MRSGKIRKERHSIIHNILFQKYRVLSLLGNGGSSSVYLAEHLKLHHHRAIKCIPKPLSQDAACNSEAGILKNLTHPGIPMIYDIEEDESYIYIIQEYVQGEALSAYLQSQNNISQESIISLGIQLCEIIEYLHNQKPKPILYLDLKPEHIILCGKQLKLIDFGIAVAVNDYENAYQGLGTRGFAAPEQYQGKSCQPQTDVFGIGAILYYMLTQEELPLFLKGSYEFPKYCSKQFKKIILKAVSPAISQRYERVEQLRQELQKLSLCQVHKKPDTHLLEKIILVGSQERIGVTHVAIGLVSWLNHQGTSALYQEHQKSSIFSQLLAYKAGTVEKDGICVYGDFKGTQGIPLETQATKSHIYVEDYGDHLAAVSEEALSELIILIIGGRPWEIQQGVAAYEKLSGEENLVLVCNHNDRQMAKKYAQIFQKKVYCFPLDENPFAITKEKHGLFQEIFKERGKRHRI